MPGLLNSLTFIFNNFIDGAQQVSVPSALSSILTEIYKFFVSANSFILIILGIVIFFAGKFAKIVGIILILLGLIHFLLPYLSKIL